MFHIPKAWLLVLFPTSFPRCPIYSAPSSFFKVDPRLTFSSKPSHTRPVPSFLQGNFHGNECFDVVFTCLLPGEKPPVTEDGSSQPHTFSGVVCPVLRVLLLGPYDCIDQMKSHFLFLLAWWGTETLFGTKLPSAYAAQDGQSHSAVPRLRGSCEH